MVVRQPTSLAEALSIRRSEPDLLAIAGGTDVMVGVNFRRVDPPGFLDLTKVRELTGYDRTGDEHRLGSAETFTRCLGSIAGQPALTEAIRTIGSQQIRNRATLGGNLGTASPAGDALPVLCCYEAMVEVASEHRGTRLIPIERFLVGPKRNALEVDELITRITWTHTVGPQVFSKVGTRNAMVIAVTNLCLVLDRDRRQVRVAIGSAGPTPSRARQAERFAVEALASEGIWEEPRTPVPRDTVAEFASLVASSATPIDDHRGTAAYRRHSLGVLAARSFDRCLTKWGDSTAQGVG